MLCSRTFRLASINRSLAAVNSASTHHREYSGIHSNRIASVLSSKNACNLSHFRRLFSASPCSRQQAQPISPAVCVASSSVSEDGQFVHVRWDNGTNASYPYGWIRDNCPCTDCFNINENISERLVPINRQSLNDRASEIHVQENGQIVHVTGTDGHSSQLEASWLFDRQLCQKESASDLDRPVLWNAAEIGTVFPIFQYRDVIQDNDALQAWLEALKVYGIALLKNSPTQESELLKLGKRVAFLREAMWGLISSIKSKPDSYVLAYTPREILLHADMPYMRLTPGVVMLHCLSLPACTGGENWLVDGFYAAKVLKETNPDAYNILTTVKVGHGITGIEHDSYFEYHLSKPTISLDDDGNPDCITYHDHLRTGDISVSTVEEAAEFYRALKLFSDILYDPANMYKRRLLEGEIFTVNNIRLLHGRDDFKVTENKARHIESAYLDWDEIDSRLHILRKGK